MIFTARQLEELHKTNGHIVLPYRARLSPMAQDWVRAKKIQLGYSDGESPLAASRTNDAAPPVLNSNFLYWCDGPCGPAKAALMAQSRESSLKEIALAPDPKNLSAVVKQIAIAAKSTPTLAAILMVQYGAAAMVMANRCQSLRAVLGTCLESVEQGLQQVAANVLVIEHPYKTLPQVKNMISRFVRAKRELSEDMSRQLKELTSCG
jgi:hypothetical protein